MKSLFWVIAVALWACDSNPTPHPGQDAGPTQTVDTGGAPPVDEDDGAEACTAAGGYWDGTSCREGITGASDTALAPAVDAGDATDGADATEDGDAGDGDAGDGGDADDAGDEGSGDAGPDDPEADTSDTSE